MKKNLQIKAVLMILFAFLFAPQSFAQTKMTRLSEMLYKTTGYDVRANNSFTKPVNLLQGVALSASTKSALAINLKSSDVSNVLGIEVNKRVLDSVILAKPDLLTLKVPVGENRYMTLNLVKVSLGEFKIKNGRGQDVSSSIANGVHYQGTFNNYSEASVASISIFNDGTIIGMLSAEGFGNRIIGKSNATSTSHVIYNVDDLKLSKEFAFQCSTNEQVARGLASENIKELLNSPTANSTCKDVKMYFECDNALYIAKGSTIQGVVQYMTGVLNQVTTIYKNESINMVVSEIKVWDTVDPYASITSTSTLVSAFSNTLNGNFNGDLAHFISGRLNQLGGGIANGIPTKLCVNGKKEMCCVSAIETTYQPLPTYSWTVNVITHEMGHILGSRHTHYCGWVGGPIDGCSGFAESDSLGNSCSTGSIPTNGGTTMSYCHQQSVGINMSLGFGPQPGNLLRAKIAAGTCFATGVTTTDPTNLQLVSTTGNAAQVQWDLVSGATYYAVEYRTSGSSAWLFAGTSNVNSITITGLSFNTIYEWRVRTSCSNFTQGTNFATPQAALQISINPLTPNTLCINSVVSVDYTISGNYNSGNIFSLRLIDNNSNIIATIATLTSNVSGSIQGTIASSVPSGTYKIRLDGSSPLVNSLASTQSFIISSSVAPATPTLTTNNVTNNTLDLTVISSAGTSTLYYVVLGQGVSAPTAQQIIDGKAGNGSPAVRFGQITVTTPNVPVAKTILGLMQGTGYDVYGTVNASNNCPSSVTKTTASTTGSPVTYCLPTMNCAGFGDYIANFKIPLAGLDNTSGCGAVNGYTYYNANSYDLTSGNQYSFTITTGTAYAQKGYIWIDMNKDGLFDDATELIYNTTSNLFIHNGTFIIPSSSSLQGLTRMRVMVAYSGKTNSCAASSNWGEVEDYLVNIGCSAIGTPPTNLSVTNIKSKKATFSWTPTPGLFTYQLKYKKVGNATWDSTLTVNGSNITVESLLPSTTYQWEIGGGCSPSVAGTSFTTTLGEITLKPLVSNSLCKGSSISLGYSSVLPPSVTNLKVEMSNSSGSFASPTTLGSTSLIVSTGGIISCYLPQAALGNYKLRIVTLPSLVVSDTALISITTQTAKAVQQAIVSNMPDEALKLKFKSSNTGKIFCVIVPFGNTIPTYQQVLAGVDNNGSPAYLIDSTTVSDSSQYFSTVRKFLYKGYFTLCAVIKDPNPCSQNVFVTPFYKATGIIPSSVGGYCSPQMGCDIGCYISNITIPSTTLNLQKTTGCGLYTQYLSTSYTLNVSTPYTIAVSTPNITYLAVWIDKNNNKIFETSEMLYQSSTNLSSHSVPFNTNSYTNGQYRMRFAIRAFGVVPEPCLSGYVGEVLDLLVNVGTISSNCWENNLLTLLSPVDDVEPNENMKRAAKGFDISNKVNQTGKLLLDYRDVVDFTPGFDSQKTSVFSVNKSPNCPTVQSINK